MCLKKSKFSRVFFALFTTLCIFFCIQDPPRPLVRREGRHTTVFNFCQKFNIILSLFYASEFMHHSVEKFIEELTDQSVVKVERVSKKFQ